MNDIYVLDMNDGISLELVLLFWFVSAYCQHCSFTAGFAPCTFYILISYKMKTVSQKRLVLIARVLIMPGSVADKN